jgi:hypothetical protein
MRALSASLVVAFLTLPALAHAGGSLRCDNRLVSEGATEAEAVAKCGEPVTKRTRTEYVTNSGYTTTHSDARRGSSERRSETAGTEVTQSSTVEDWTYNFGPNRLMQTATFRDGVLVDVRSGARGF